ncbi:MAG: hypothetical protein PHE33_10115, partial [Bacteroidales bacterium]|nr:hypothetical protein [Bacteroidales bacterium]
MKDLNKIIKDKLENYQETPPQGILDNIRNKYPKRSFVENLNYNKYYIVAGIGAIIIAGFFIFNNPPTTNNNTQISKDEKSIIQNNHKSANEPSNPKTDNEIRTNNTPK